MGFFKLILLIVLIYFVLRYIGRLLFGIASQRSSATQSQRKQDFSGRKEGDVNVNPKSKQQQDKKIKKDEGEYINYEEIKDK